MSTSSSSTPRAARTTALLLVLQLALGAVTFTPPTARADQVPSGSLAYGHLGDNLLRTATTEAGTLGAALDGNTSSEYVLQVCSGNCGSSPVGGDNGCGAGGATNVTISLGSTAGVDLIHAYVGFQQSGVPTGGGGTVGLGVLYTDGSYNQLACNAVGFGFTGTTYVDAWLNLTTKKTISNFFTYSRDSGCNCPAYLGKLHLGEIEAYDKNSTTSDPIVAIADEAAAGLTCLSKAASGSPVSQTYTAPLGTSYLFVPAIIHSATNLLTPDQMQIAQTIGSGLTAMFSGWGHVEPDVTGQRSGAVAIWKIVAPQAGLGYVVKPSGAGTVATTDTVCRYTRLDAIGSSTLANGYVFANLATWGGTTSEVWGIVHMSNGYPINPVYDSDLSGTGSLFSQDNMTFGTQLFAAGAPSGSSTTISIAALPTATRAGNAILLALGQGTAAATDPSAYEVMIAGYPAQAIAYGTSTTNAFKYALFFVDDVAVRNNVSNAAGNVGQSWYRPLGAESYQVTIKAGFDPTQAIYAGNTIGRDGHAGLVCLTLCTSNLLRTYAQIPTTNHNSVYFHAQNRTGASLAGVRIMNQNTTDTRTTDANGNAWFNDTFDSAYYRLTDAGYASLCADYYFTPQGGALTGTDANGCAFVRAFNATYTATLLTTAESGGGNSGGVNLGGGTGLPTQPQSNSATSADYGIAQSWAPPADDGGSLVTRYDVYRGSTSGMTCDSGSLVGSVDANTLTYQHVGLIASATYFVRVRADNQNGNGTCAPPVSARTNDAPTQPQGVNANVVIGGIVVQWSPPANNGTAGGSIVDDYRVWYADGANVGCASTSSVIDLHTTNALVNFTIVQTGHTYYFYPQAHSPVGWGVCSPGASATYNLNTPSAPTSLTTTSTLRGRVYVNWSQPADQGSFPLDGYWIYRGTLTGAGGGSCAPPSALVFVANTSSPQSFIDSNAPVNTQLYYKVSATNAAGEGSCTNPVGGEAVADPPTQPQSVQVSAYAGRNQVTWLPPADDGGTPIAQYRVWSMDQVDGGCGAASTEVTVPASQLTFNDTTYTPHVARYYYVQALSQLVGVCSPPGAGVTNNVGKPGAPASLTSTTHLQNFVWLNWTQPTDNGGLAITNFYVYRTSDATTNICTNSQTLAYVLSGTNLTWKDFSVLDGVTYHYRVSALNQAGEGPCTGVSNGAIDPYQGQTITLASDETLAANGTASLAWTSVQGADAYNIYRALTANDATRPMNASQYVYITTLTATSYQEAISVTTHYRVVATSAHLGEGPVSNDAEATVCAAKSLTPQIALCANLTRIVPYPVMVQLQRTQSDQTLLTVLRWSPLTGEYTQEGSSVTWTYNMPATLSLTYPGSRATTSGDEGAYTLLAQRGSTYLGSAQFRILTNWTDEPSVVLPAPLTQDQGNDLAGTINAQASAESASADNARLTHAAGSVDVGSALTIAVWAIPLILILLFAGLILRNS